MLVDLSLTLKDGVVLRPGSPPVEIRDVQCWNPVEGDYKTTVYSSPLHAGTHIDLTSPGRKIPVERLIGQGRVIDVSHLDAGRIRLEDIEDPGVSEGEFAFIQTGWDRFLGEKKYEEHPELEVEVVEWLASRKVNMVGIDAMGLARLDKHGEYDRYLFDHDVYVIENLVNLGRVESPVFKAYCLPLNIEGVEAVPARILIDTWPHDA